MNLKHYSALAAAFLAVKDKSDAQILYTEVNQVCSDTCTAYVDLNHDGIVDFIFKANYERRVYSSSWWNNKRLWWLENEPQNNNSFYEFAIGSEVQIPGLLNQNFFEDKNTSIASWECKYGSSSGGETTCFSEGGSWTIKGRFMPVIVRKDTHKYYGWIRLQYVDHHFYLYDYAIDTVPNEPIVTGEIPCAKNLVSISTNSDTTEICEGVPVLLESKSPIEFTYQWLKNDSAITGATSVNYSATLYGNYSLAIKNSFGCADTSNTIFLNYLLNPAPVLSAREDSLFSTSSPTVKTYSWFESMSPLPIAGASDSFYVAKDNDTYWVQTIKYDGCKATSNYVTIKDCNLVIADILENDTSLCQGDTLLLQAYYDPYYQYHWQFHDQNISGATNSEFAVSDSGIYRLLAKDYSGCKANYDSVEISYYQIPVITEVGDTLISSYNENNQWYLDDQPIQNATNQGYLAHQSGSYYVQVTVSNSNQIEAPDNGCVLRSDSIEFVVTASPNSLGQLNPVIYLIGPGLLQVQFPNEEFLHGKIKILNVSGQEIKQLTIDKNILRIPFSENETGWFLVDIEKDEHRYHSQVLIF